MNDAQKVSVRPLGAELWRTKRDLRLAALQQDGHWFGGNYADAAARTPQQWVDWPGGVVFAAFVGDDARGIAAGRRNHGGVELISMWVRPEGRGRGLAARLIDAIADWARSQRCTSLYLEVVPRNESARRAYGNYGFTETELPPRDSGNIVMQFKLEASDLSLRSM